MIPADKEVQLKALVDGFLYENSRINLSALRTVDACWNGNVLDSLSFLELSEVDPSQEKTVLDIGTGGGFPLLPLALCLPNWKFTGLDSVQKKIDAVRRIYQEMNLSNVEVLSERAEVLAHEDRYREQFDFVLSRAVAPINVLIEYCAPFAKVGGHIVLWKSTKIDQELEESLLARAELSTHLVKKHQYTLPGDWGDRLLLVFEKTFATKQEYPREVGIPKKTPLL